MAQQSSYLRNIWVYDVEAESGPGILVDVSDDYVEVRGCYIQPTVTGVIGIDAQSSFLAFRETKIESGGVSVASRPAIGLRFSAEGSMTDIDVRGVELSNSRFGFSSPAFDEDEAVARLYVISMTQSFGADVFINASTTGIVNPETASGSALVDWG
jgi:hypothetical protein